MSMGYVSSYALGQLLGRAAASYVLVWLACWLLSRFHWRTALQRSTRWYSLLAVLLLTLLGVGIATTRGGSLG
jgi:hypothetical protein